MRILYIRHAEAVEADDFPGADVDRPLTTAGQKAFQRMARLLARRYRRVEWIVASGAERARATADILAKVFKVREVKVMGCLNPGAGPFAYLRILPARAWTREGVGIVVGHEPALSAAIASLVGGKAMRIKMKKGACAEVEWTGPRSGRLRALLDPAWAGPCR